MVLVPPVVIVLLHFKKDEERLEVIGREGDTDILALYLELVKSNGSLVLKIQAQHDVSEPLLQILLLAQVKKLVLAQVAGAPKSDSPS